MRVASLPALALAITAGCGGPTRMGGFPEQDARAVQPVPSETIPDACSWRNGRLVVEVERAVINEFPNRDEDLHRREQPLLVRSLAFTDHLDEEKDERDLQSWVTPRKYKSGERIDGFEGLRVMELPLRRIAGRSLILRLAENDRTFPPEWVTRTTQASGAVGGAAALGIAAPPAAVVQEGVELFARLDRDDRILVWTVALEQLAQDTAPAASSEPTANAPTRPVFPARRYQLATTRRLPATGAGPAVPSAQLTLVAYREPEAGCGN
jgi:hypothetical protein